MKFLKILLLISVIVLYGFLGYQGFRNYSHAVTIGLNHRTDRFMPYFDFLYDLSCQRKKAEHLQLVRYIKYYQFLNANYANEYSILEILAFCYFYDNKDNLAMMLYQNSISKNPHFFWNYYNLGLLYLSQNNIKQAKSYFQQALNLEPRDSLKTLFSSRAYIQILFANHLGSKEVAISLKDGYQKTSKYLQFLNASGDPKRIPIHPKLF